MQVNPEDSPPEYMSRDQIPGWPTSRIIYLYCLLQVCYIVDNLQANA